MLSPESNSLPLRCVMTAKVSSGGGLTLRWMWQPRYWLSLFRAPCSDTSIMCLIFGGGIKVCQASRWGGTIRKVCVCVWRRGVGSEDLPGSCAAGGAVSPPGGVAQRDGTATAAVAEAAAAAPGAGAAMFVWLRGSSAVYVHQHTLHPPPHYHTVELDVSLPLSLSLSLSLFPPRNHHSWIRAKLTKENNNNNKIKII